MTVDDFTKAVKDEFAKRKFAVGLAIALMRFVRHLSAGGLKFDSLEDFFRKYPRVTTTSAGKTVNALTVRLSPDSKKKTLGIRPFYNVIESYIRAEKRRFGYPNCAPHATQAWIDYQTWLEAIVQMSEAESAKAESELIEFVLQALPEHAAPEGAARAVKGPFTRLLDKYESLKSVGPHGATFQGLGYAYIRADAPHLHLDVAKVGAGSKRLNRVGDIDGWEGAKLILTVEAKGYAIGSDDLAQLAGFQNSVERSGALGIVFAETFDEDAVRQLEQDGLRSFDLEDLKRSVALWDPLKQQAAFSAFEYYVHHVEKNKAMMECLATAFAEEPTPTSPIQS
jgi:hypothetical protein